MAVDMDVGSTGRGGGVPHEGYNKDGYNRESRGRVGFSPVSLSLGPWRRPHSQTWLQQRERDLRRLFAVRGNAAHSSTEREPNVNCFHEAMTCLRQTQQERLQQEPEDGSAPILRSPQERLQPAPEDATQLA